MGNEEGDEGEDGKEEEGVTGDDAGDQGEFGAKTGFEHFAGEWGRLEDGAIHGGGGEAHDGGGVKVEGPFVLEAAALLDGFLSGVEGLVSFVVEGFFFGELQALRGVAEGAGIGGGYGLQEESIDEGVGLGEGFLFEGTRDFFETLEFGGVCGFLKCGGDGIRTVF